MLKIISFIVGAAVLATTAHVTIVASGGYEHPTALLIIAVACGVAIGALALGAARGEGRYAVSRWLIATIVAGEAFGLQTTAERIVTAREAQQVPIRDALQRHIDAAKRALTAQTALDSLPSTSARLEAAIAAKSSADAAVLKSASTSSCAKNCRDLLHEQVANAQHDVELARSELSAARSSAETELSSAHAALDAAKLPPSPTPLSDRTGIPQWVLDLIAAGLGAMSANGLGIGLMAFAAHRPKAVEMASTVVVDVKEPEVISPPRTRLSPHIEADRFARDVFLPDDAGLIPLADIRGAYASWCAANELEPLPDDQIGRALSRLFSKVGLEKDGAGIKGITWRN